jgi:hypothetical protein
VGDTLKKIEAQPPLRRTILAVCDEVVRARRKFPDPENPNFAALVEEVGELAKAMIEKLTPEEIRSEAVQVACMAIRIIEEGDQSLGIGPEGASEGHIERCACTAAPGCGRPECAWTRGERSIEKCRWCGSRTCVCDWVNPFANPMDPSNYCPHCHCKKCACKGGGR